MVPVNSLGSTVVPIHDEEEGSSIAKKKPSPLSFLSSLLQKIGVEDPRKVVHCIKVGFALVLVSLLYLLQPLYDKFGDNAMWAIMTVVVVFEFSAGATLSKGLNRGMGTILGGGLGCLSALLARSVGGNGKAIAIAISVFIFGMAATYFRLVPSVKKKFEYGIVIFILTFNLVAVSGFRGEEIIKLAKDRLLTITIGFSISLFTSLLIFPVWAGDELHRSLKSKFDNVASSIEECLKEYFKLIDVEKTGTQSSGDLDRYKSVLHSKSSDESLANFARWEPWHGRFGFSYPWNKYLHVGEFLRELAASMIQLKACLPSHRQSPQCIRSTIKEPCEAMAVLICSALKELGDTIFNMRKCQRRESIVAELKMARQELNSTISTWKLGTLGNQTSSIRDELSMASFVFMLMEMVDKVEMLAKEVQELGELAGFISQ
ncbi:aluminum-activated malate transporter 12-like [Magnolia sinica]|uniref:aluminum-activated malate transporter 12-like n=1 Tax=Magnolia sinica TaxID=86752 RepID=UPI002658812A|nr:aluminum-activated malate transporter 12-like [Magnolia sinica]